MDEEYYSYTRKWFRRLAPVYDIIVVFISGVRDKVVDFINPPNGSRILDVATGTGKQAFAFAKKGHELIGVDLSEDMLRVAKKKNKYQNLKFEAVDATNLPFGDKYFDVSCVAFALHDMPLSIREEVLAEMVRVTKAKGLIAIVDYGLPRNKIGRSSIYYLVKFYEGKYYPEFVKSDLKALLRKQGIEIEKDCSILLGAGRILKGIKIDEEA